jgi:hypothetical protein
MGEGERVVEVTPLVMAGMVGHRRCIAGAA